MIWNSLVLFAFLVQMCAGIPLYYGKPKLAGVILLSGGLLLSLLQAFIVVRPYV
jgi:hypothetical protein